MTRFGKKFQIPKSKSQKTNNKQYQNFKYETNYFDFSIELLRHAIQFLPSQIQENSFHRAIVKKCALFCLLSANLYSHKEVLFTQRSICLNIICTNRTRKLWQPVCYPQCSIYYLEVSLYIILLVLQTEKSVLLNPTPVLNLSFCWLRFVISCLVLARSG